MKYSNPLPRFHFEHGITPFYVCICLENWIPVSILVFANDKKHAVKIAKDAIQFRIDQKSGMMVKDTPLLLTDQATISVHEIDKHQLYKVGWASNDTIL